MGHRHVFLGERHERNERRTRWVVALTAVMMVGEIIAGHLFNSMALLADGFHMATHAGALAVAAAAYAFARRHAENPRFSFGTGKVGDLAGFASALVLAVISLGIAVESAARLFDPRPVAFLEATVVAMIGLAVNLASAMLLSEEHHGHDHDHHHHHHDHDNNRRAAFAHVMADALTSVLAIVALLAGRYLGWFWLDPAMGLVGAVVIALWARRLIRDTAAVLLDTTDSELETEVRAQLAGLRIADLHIWRIGPGAHAAIVSAAGAEPQEIRRRLAPVHELAHVTVEVG